MPTFRAGAIALLAVQAALAASPAVAQSALSGETIRMSRAAGPITIDGRLGDEGWRGAVRVVRWYETNPGDNTEPPVRNVGYLTFDDRYFYAGFEFDDPNPSRIRAPYADRDNISDGYDFGGLIVDAGNTGRTAAFFVVTAHNTQYDAITDDTSGEDSSPDFFWESATAITDHGWTAEIKIPFSSLRYRPSDPQTWRILLYRNYPREFRYQFFSAQLPRGSNCFVCRFNMLTGLERLPGGGHLVAAPYVAAARNEQPRDDLGSPLVADGVTPRVGLDVKYTPNADHAIDLTVKPDFSQVESDVAQISANERFALFYPEKRPFFLEGVDLFQTQIQAVYTRTITSPSWGGRLTGKSGGIRYTALATEDGGGGSVIIPGPNDSSLAPQDFPSTVFVGRAKREVGLSFLGVLVTDREGRGTGSYNRVAGPDFEWRASEADVLSGQWLYGATRTPNRPADASEWTGQSFASHAGSLTFGHTTTHYDASLQYKDIGSDFRADVGFVPQVGYREGYAGTGWTFRPTGFVRRLRTFANFDYQVDRGGDLISRSFFPGFGMDTRWNGFVQLRYIDDSVRAVDRPIGRRQFGYIAQFSPSRLVSRLAVDGRSGQEIDFANGRAGAGTTLNLTARLDPTEHLDLTLVQNQRWIDVDADGRRGARLLTARISRLRSTYTFTSRLFVRAITQYVSTDRDPALYTSDVAPRSATLSGQVLLAYKLNWQSVMFVGYGDDRELSDLDRLEKLDRQLFVKLSYAIQR